MIEPLEDRRLLALAVSDEISVAAGGLVTVNGSPWGNDEYNASWPETECLDGLWHELWTEEPVYHEDGYFDEENNWIDTSYWEPEEAVEHPGWYECFEQGSVTHYATGSISYSGPGTLTTEGGDAGTPLTFSYTAPTNFEGAISFGYSLNDNGDPTSASGTITIQIGNPPVAGNASYGTPIDTPLSKALPVTDDDNDPITTAIATQAQHGTATVNANGTFTYTPAEGYAGTDSFTFTASDGLVSATGSVSIRVTRPPDPVSDIYETDEDTPLVVTAAAGLLANDTDPDGDTFSALLVTSPAHGTVELNGAGSFTYTPAGNYHGPDAFAYAASDGICQTEATVAITVNALYDPPQSVADDYFVNLAGGGAISIAAAAGVLANDLNADGAAISAVLDSEPVHGSLTFHSDGSFDYTATAGYEGSDSFTYHSTDGQNSGGVAAVNLFIGNYDFAATNFTTDGTNLSVGYTVAGEQAPAFSIGLYASPDGVQLGQLLELIPAETTAGSHTLTFLPTFDDLQEDYYLVAVVDGADEVPEADETNNTVLFAGGAFVVHEASSESTVLQYFGNESGEWTQVAPLGSGLWLVTSGPIAPQINLSPQSGGPPYYDVTGDGKATRLDADAVIYNQTHSQRPWQNPTNRWDANGDGYVVAGDALLIINEVDLRGDRLLNQAHAAGSPYFDVSGDSVLSDIDADQVINKINGGSGYVLKPWRNVTNPNDVSGEGVADLSDALAILDFLGISHEIVETIALDQIHLRTHGGNDTVSTPLVESDQDLWIFGGEGNNKLTGGNGDNVLSAGDGNNTVIGGSGQNTIEVGDGANTITAGDAGDTIFAGNGDNAVTGGTGADTILVGNGNNGIHSGNGDDYISAGAGNNSINAGAGDDHIHTGSGDNGIVGGDGNDGVNEVVDRPKIQMEAAPDVREGDAARVLVWLSAATDHDVTATLTVHAENSINTSERWEQMQVNVLIPAGEFFVNLTIQSADDELLNGSDSSTVSLVGPNGADLGAETTAPVFLWDNDDSIWVDFEDPESDTSFAGELRAERTGDIRLEANGPGGGFDAEVTIDDEGIFEFEMTRGEEQWAGTSLGAPGVNGRYPMQSLTGTGTGNFGAIPAAEPPPQLGMCRPMTAPPRPDGDFFTYPLSARGFSWVADAQARTLTLVLHVYVVPVTATQGEADVFKEELKRLTEAEFNAQNVYLLPTQGVCAAWKPKLQIVYESENKGIQVDLYVEEATSSTNSNDVNNIVVRLDLADVKLWHYRDYGTSQYSAVHEMGHVIGLRHPGADNGYTADAKALMGIGMELRTFYFYVWADKLSQLYPNYAPWVPWGFFREAN